MCRIKLLVFCNLLPAPLDCEQKAINYRLQIGPLHYTATTTYHRMATGVEAEKRVGSRREV